VFFKAFKSRFGGLAKARFGKRFLSPESGPFGQPRPAESDWGLLLQAVVDEVRRATRSMFQRVAAIRPRAFAPARRVNRHAAA
jgi:hypothetical protein